VFSGCRPLAISTSLPCPSWSVFDQWKHNGDPLGVGLEVFAADCSQFRPPQASGKPDHDQARSRDAVKGPPSTISTIRRMRLR
jgi:hypothetical protein